MPLGYIEYQAGGRVFKVKVNDMEPSGNAVAATVKAAREYQIAGRIEAETQAEMDAGESPETIAAKGTMKEFEANTDLRGVNVIAHAEGNALREILVIRLCSVARVVVPAATVGAFCRAHPITDDDVEDQFHRWLTVMRKDS